MTRSTLSLRVWFFFVVTETVLCLTPGPAVLFILSCGLARGGRAALWGNAGILSANTFYFVVSAFGLGAVLLGSHELFTVVKYRRRGVSGVAGDSDDSRHRTRPRTNSDVQPRVQGWHMLARGFALQAANPKALLFFVALLPQFVDVHQAIAPQMVILATTSALVEFAILAGYGYFAGRAAALAREARFVTATNRASGGLLIATGTLLALKGNR